MCTMENNVSCWFPMDECSAGVILLRPLCDRSDAQVMTGRVQIIITTKAFVKFHISAQAFIGTLQK